VAVVSIAQLKTYFNRLDKPTEAQYVDTIDTLATAPSFTGTTTIESGTFTLAADGLSATGGVLTNPGATPTLEITTTKKLKLWQGICIKTGQPVNYSDGRSDGIIQNSNGAGINGSTVSVDSSNCIHVQEGNPGDQWVGQILLADITDTSYKIKFTQVGSGLAITGQWHGIMG